MNIPEIAKCPGCNPAFAGLSPRVNTANGSQHWVFCPECGMHGPCGVGEQDAIERWNAICRQPTPEAEEPTAYEITGIDGDLEYTRLDYCSEPLRAGEEISGELFAHPPKPEPTEAVENLDHILDAEHSARILGFPIMACWCCGKPAEVSMADTCARCTDDLCWAHSSWIPVVAWNKRHVAPKPPAEWMREELEKLANRIGTAATVNGYDKDTAAVLRAFRDDVRSLAKHYEHAPKVPEGGK